MTYIGSGDPARKSNDYHPWWLDNLADDVTCEGAAMNGAAQGAEAVRSIVVTARTLYEGQEFNFAGPYGDNGFLEDYTTQVHGEPIGVIVLVTRKPAGETEQLLDGGGRQRGVLFSWEGAEAVPGLRRDHGADAGDHVTELLEHDRRLRSTRVPGTDPRPGLGSGPVLRAPVGGYLWGSSNPDA